ncbi:MAG TPA: hypothetical protein VER14_09080 [Phototrophicaceae bacterium]|nr:hypothetical protein [Phototrophicaceae bacterium]
MNKVIGDDEDKEEQNILFNALYTSTVHLCVADRFTNFEYEYNTYE